MTHVYVQGGIEREISESTARINLRKSIWYQCEATGHNLDGEYDDDVVVYHNLTHGLTR